MAVISSALHGLEITQGVYARSCVLFSGTGTATTKKMLLLAVILEELGVDPIGGCAIGTAQS